jgi:hypothetical protein
VRIRGLIFLALAGGAAYWVYRTRPTVTGFVDNLTRPLMSSHAAVKESEQKRVADSVPVAPEGEQISTETIHEGMKKSEVEDLLGRPDRIEEFPYEGKTRVRWIYRESRRILVFDEGRVVSITVR